MSNKTLETALMWRNLGIGVIPILARSKSPALDKWKPYQSRLPSEFELRMWFSRPGYIIAVSTGWQGLVIVDFDSAAAWERFVSSGRALAHHALNPRGNPLTYYVLTPRGRHLYFYCRESIQCARLDGVDIKANGGYCLTSPSIHPLGRAYLSAFDPYEIAHLKSITDILPEYQQAISRPPPRPRASTLHPLDAAMLPHTSTTIEEANDKLSYNQLLSINHYNTSPRNEMVSHYHCPLHDDAHASFVVYTNGWYCFGCNVGGRDKLDLYAQLNGMTIAEALCTL